ncbi:hydantoinase/oxoprolinase family protein [Streptomyces sp. NPDC046197]|uniref:hydantoinase/oxoprolinase family protein n=1 Tax=Streptomyces sp. NPDC046197 TaxID=3154337 RepID=UPI0033C95F10
MTATEELRLGIDVGGTNTDAAVVDSAGTLVAKAKVPTTDDLSVGVEQGIARLLADPAVDPARVRCATLGARRATNAIRTASGLRHVAVLRIGAPLTSAIPPMVAWPPELRRAVHAGSATVAGGCEFDGKPIAALDEAAIVAFASEVGTRAAAVAITAVFSLVNPADELRAAEIMRRELGEIPISMSHEIGVMGLVERENATILNAALSGVAAGVGRSFHTAVERNGLDAECYITQNDGTLMALDYSMRFPVLTIGSGPANSMRGGAHSSGVTDAIVADIGGATTAVGRLVNGFPWESLPPNSIGGVDTNFRLPDVLSIPIGGGSVVLGPAEQWANGQLNVGSSLVDEALCFGGPTPTITDAAVAAGRAAIATCPVPAKWHTRLAQHLALCDGLLAEAVDRVRLGADDLPLVVVGGGGHIAPDHFSGVREVIRPPHFEVANALGAAIAPVSGHAERICASRPDQLRAAVDEVSADAVGRAIQAGADPTRVRVVDVEEVPLTYLREPAVRIKVRAVGPPVTFNQQYPEPQKRARRHSA